MWVWCRDCLVVGQVIRRAYGDLFHLDQRFLGVIGRNSPLRSKLGKDITGCIRYDVEDDVVLLANYFQRKDASLSLVDARAKALSDHRGPSTQSGTVTPPCPCQACPTARRLRKALCMLGRMARTDAAANSRTS